MNLTLSKKFVLSHLQLSASFCLLPCYHSKV